jgi:hypothetical protein
MILVMEIGQDVVFTPASSDGFSESTVLLACFSTNSDMGKVWGLFLHTEWRMADASETKWAGDAPLILHTMSGGRNGQVSLVSQMELKYE